MGDSAKAKRKAKRSRVVVAEINVTPMVDVMLVLLIIFMVAAGVQTVEMQSDRQRMQEATEDRLAEAEAAIAELERMKQHAKVAIDLPKVNAEPVKLSQVRKLKLEIDDQLRFTIDGTVLVDCLKESPRMRRYIGKERDPKDTKGEDAAFSPCVKILGEKLVDNKKLQEDKELYVLASRSLHYGQVLRVMAAVRQAGITKFGLVAEGDLLGDAAVEKSQPEVP